MKYISARGILSKICPLTKTRAVKTGKFLRKFNKNLTFAPFKNH